MQRRRDGMPVRVNSRRTDAARDTTWKLSLIGFGGAVSLDEQSVQDALAQRLPKFKLPKRMIFVEELPRTAMGKVQKNVLRETFKDLFHSRAGN